MTRFLVCLKFFLVSFDSVSVSVSVGLYFGNCKCAFDLLCDTINFILVLFTYRSNLHASLQQTQHIQSTYTGTFTVREKDRTKKQVEKRDERSMRA